MLHQLSLLLYLLILSTFSQQQFHPLVFWLQVQLELPPKRVSVLQPRQLIATSALLRPPFESSLLKQPLLSLVYYLVCLISQLRY